MSGEFRSFCYYGSGNIQVDLFASGQFNFVDTRAKSETPTLVNGAFQAGTVAIINDAVSGNLLEFSFGRDVAAAFVVHGRLNGGEAITMDRRFEDRVYMRAVTSGSGGIARIFAW
jgi:hypothetical protein